MAGELISWAQILREHPMLGQITITELVNAGVVQVVPDFDAGTGRVEYWLRKRETEEVGGSLDPETSRTKGSIDATTGRGSRENGIRRRGVREMKA
jgi:hypothetical protein